MARAQILMFGLTAIERGEQPRIPYTNRSQGFSLHPTSGVKGIFQMNLLSDYLKSLVRLAIERNNVGTLGQILYADGSKCRGNLAQFYTLP